MEAHPDGELIRLEGSPVGGLETPLTASVVSLDTGYEGYRMVYRVLDEVDITDMEW